jgi:hypothetical protein
LRRANTNDCSLTALADRWDSCVADYRRDMQARSDAVCQFRKIEQSAPRASALVQ